MSRPAENRRPATLVSPPPREKELPVVPVWNNRQTGANRSDPSGSVQPASGPLPWPADRTYRQHARRHAKKRILGEGATDLTGPPKLKSLTAGDQIGKVTHKAARSSGSSMAARTAGMRVDGNLWSRQGEKRHTTLPCNSVFFRGLLRLGPQLSRSYRVRTENIASVRLRAY